MNILNCLSVSFVWVMLFCPFFVQSIEEAFYLKNNLQEAKTGDFIVVAVGKTLTLMHIYDKTQQVIVVEEISVPEQKAPKDWKKWLDDGAKGNNHWILYEIDLQTGHRLRSYSFTKNYWFEIAENDDLLIKILNLKLHKLPLDSRKKIGPKPHGGSDFRALWQPKVVVEGSVVKGVLFDAWWTKWPSDGSDLAGRTIEVYTPQSNQRYPAYFPYWLEITGTVGKAKLRIVDSGFDLTSPKPSLDSLL